MTDLAPDTRTLLLERARRLARIDDNRLDGSDADQAAALLVMRLGEELAGIALEYITEVHRPVRLTPIPGARPPVAGVIAWRGRVLTVLDIALHRAGPVVIGEATRIVVIGQRRAAFGIIADEVEDVRHVNMDDTAPVENVEPGRNEFIRRVTSDALVIVDAPALIARFAPTH